MEDERSGTPEPAEPEAEDVAAPDDAKAGKGAAYGWRQWALIVLCLGALVGAYFNLLRGYRKVGVLPRPMPKWVLERPMELIDEETGKLMTRPMGEWERGEKKVDRYQNPETGRLTMVYPMVCYECGAKVVPPKDFQLGKKNYKCPKCGAPAMYCACEEPPKETEEKPKEARP